MIQQGTIIQTSQGKFLLQQPTATAGTQAIPQQLNLSNLSGLGQMGATQQVQLATGQTVQVPGITQPAAVLAQPQLGELPFLFLSF